MLAEMTTREYLPLAPPSPESGPSQEGASILADGAHSIGLIPPPLFALETESQSSFDQDAQVFDLSIAVVRSEELTTSIPREVEPQTVGKDGNDATSLVASGMSWKTTVDHNCGPFCFFA